MRRVPKENIAFLKMPENERSEYVQKHAREIKPPSNGPLVDYYPIRDEAEKTLRALEQGK